MGIDIESACSTCKEIFWLGSAKASKWSGFQFGNRQVFSWFARHAHPNCKVFIGNDHGSLYLWEADLTEEQRKTFKYMAYDTENSQWYCVSTEESRDDADSLTYYPNLYSSDYKVNQPMTADGETVHALSFSFEMSDISIVGLNEYDLEDIEHLKNPLVLHYKDLAIENVAVEWADQIYYLSSHSIFLSVVLASES